MNESEKHHVVENRLSATRWAFLLSSALLAPVSTPETLWLIPCNCYWKQNTWLERGGLSEETGGLEGLVTMAIPAWSAGDIRQE